MIRLGVNIDHVATLRQARRGREPDPVAAAALAELGGADGITLHLREDRRHVQERDLRLLRQTARTHLNLELAAVEEVIGICLEVHPDQATFVPERREEVTTEGGLDVNGNLDAVREAVGRVRKEGIRASLFIDPDPLQVEAARVAGAQAVELHTGAYAEAFGSESEELEFQRLVQAGRTATKAGVALYAGHGLDYWNVQRVRELEGLVEVNIGHSIISRAVLVGLVRAVREMKDLLERRRRRL